MTRIELYWLAGILEGEGCFLLATTRAYEKIYLHPRIDLAMTDNDIVRRVAKLIGGTCRLQKYSIAKNRRYKKIWKTSVYSLRALQLMQKLYPILGARRQRKIRQIITKRNKVRARKWGHRHIGETK